MGTWNYRVIHHKGERGEWLGLHEVFYDNDGKIEMWDSNPELVVDVDEGVEGMKATAEMMAVDAVKAPVLEAADLPSNTDAIEEARQEAGIVVNRDEETENYELGQLKLENARLRRQLHDFQDRHAVCSTTSRQGSKP